MTSQPGTSPTASRWSVHRALQRLLRSRPRTLAEVLRMNLGAALLSAAGVVAWLAASLGYIEEGVSGVRLLWLGDGWVLALLLLADRQRWLALLFGLVAAETLTWWTIAPHESPIRPLFFALLGATQCAVLAALSLRFVPILAHWRDRPITGLRFLLLSVLVPVPFAFLSAYIWLQFEGGPGSVLVDGQIWWVADALGFLIVTPLVLAFALPRGVFRPVHGAGRIESITVLAATLAAVLVSFGGHPDSPATLLDLPFAVFPPLVWAAVRCQPRVVNVALFATVLVAFKLTLDGRGPFAESSDEPTAIVYSTQIFFTLLTLTVHALVISIVDQRVLRQDLRSERRRYRSFIANSSEAIFRVDIKPPIDIAQDRSVVVNQMIDRAVIEECNLAYAAALENDEILPQTRRPWRTDAFWFDLMLEHFDEAMAQGFSLRGLEVTVRRPTGDLVDLLVSFRGVVEGGALKRLWGTATDVTKLHRVQRELEQQRAQLRVVTSEWIVAEDRARRLMAHELENGVCEDIEAITELQSGLIDRLQDHPLRGDVLEIGRLARHASDSCDRIIEDLDPVELTQEGLRRALEALVERHRAAGRRVTVQLRIGEWIERIPAPLAVLSYRVARELLLDAEAQPHVDAVRLAIDRPGGSLRIRFVEHGQAWRGEAPAARRISTLHPRLSDRIQALGGLLTMAQDAAGGFTTFTIEVPIGSPSRPRPQSAAPKGQSGGQ